MDNNNNQKPLNSTGRPDYRLKNRRKPAKAVKGPSAAPAAEKPNYKLGNNNKDTAPAAPAELKPVESAPAVQAESAPKKPDYRLKGVVRPKQADPVPTNIKEEIPAAVPSPEVIDPEPAMTVQEQRPGNAGFTVPAELVSKLNATLEEDAVEEQKPETDAEATIEEPLSVPEPAVPVQEDAFINSEPVQEPVPAVQEAVQEPEPEQEQEAGRAIKPEADTVIQPVFLGANSAKINSVELTEEQEPAPSLHELAESMAPEAEDPEEAFDEEEEDWTAKFEPQIAEDDADPEPEPAETVRRRTRKAKPAPVAEYVEEFDDDSKNKPFSSKKGRRHAKQAKKGNNALVIAIVVGLALILVLGAAGVIGYTYIQKTLKAAQTSEETGYNNLTVDTSANSEREAPAPLKNRNVFFAGIDNSTCDQTTVVYLENPPENEDFLMKYQIYSVDAEGNKGELLKETDLIPSGQHVNWTPAKDLEPGEHKVIFSEQPFMQQGEDFLPLTAGENQVVLTIIK